MKNENDSLVESRVRDFAAQVKDLIRVDSNDEYARLAHALVDLRQAQEYVAARKEQLTLPAKSVLKTAADWFGGTEKQITATEDTLKRLLGEYIDRRLPEVREASKEAIGAGDMLALASSMVVVPNVPGVTLRNDVDFVVFDENMVPDEFFKPQEIHTARVKAALKEGQDIPGIRRQDRTSLAISTKDRK